MSATKISQTIIWTWLGIKERPCCQKDVNHITLNLKLSFTNIQGLHSNFVEPESFLESNTLDILALCETNLDGSVDSGNLSVRESSLKILCYSYVTYNLCKERTSFCRGLISRKLCGFSLMFSSDFTSFVVLLLFPLSITFFVVMHGFWCSFI